MIGKGYLSAEEKRMLFLVSAYNIKVQEYLETLEKSNSDKTFVKYLKYIRTYTSKVRSYMLNGLDVKYGLTMAKQIKGFDIIVGYKDEISRARENFKKAESEVVMDRDDVYSIVDFSLANCAICEDVGDDALNCNIRNIYIKYGVDIINNECDAKCIDGCPYRYNLKKEGACL